MNSRIPFYTLVIVGVFKIAMSFYLSDMTDKLQNMKTDFDEIKVKVQNISAFEDSLLHNAYFRKHVFDTTNADLNELLAQNKIHAGDIVVELEQIRAGRQAVEQNYRTLNIVDSILNLLLALATILIIYRWVK